MSEQYTVREPDNFYKLKLLDPYMVGHKGYIAGGCFKNIFNNEPFKDVDIFFENEQDFNSAVNCFEDNGKYRKAYENSKVIAFKNTDTNIRAELCRSIFGKPEDVINEFDFSITKFAYYKEYEETEDGINIEYKVVYHQDFFEHLLTKRLVLEPVIKYPASTFERALRYTKYGYGLCKDSKKYLIENIRNIRGDIDISASLYDGVD